MPGVGGIPYGGIEARWINSGTERRRAYIDVGEVKMGIGSNEGDQVRLVMKL